MTKDNTVRHDGQTYLENREFKLPLEEAQAQRLIRLSVVTDVDQLRKQALKRAAPTISIQSSCGMMGINWDRHLLAPLHGVFGDPVEYRPAGSIPYTRSGIFDRAYTQDVDPLDDGSTINTTQTSVGCS